MLVVDRPRFRQDLVAEAIEEGGHKFIDVGDPESGSMFRFYEVEFSIACGMDGERDVAGLVQWAKDELGLVPSVNEVRNVIATLSELNFLDQTAATRVAATERPAPAAAAAARDTELAAGVVVGQQPKRPAAPAVDVELGHAGSKAAPSQPLPKGGDIELGTPGAGAAAAAAAKTPRAPVEDVGLGAPGARTTPVPPKSDVSLDLADHMGVKPDDVKEAVRQSKQMTAVEVPKELLAEVEAPVPPPKTEPKPATSKPAEAKAASVAKPAAQKSAEAKVDAKPVETKPAEKKPAEKKPAEKAAAEKKPAEKAAAEKKPATTPVIAEKQSAKPTAPRRGISPMLILLLILAIGGAGAYFAWRYVIRGKDPTAEVKPPPVSPGSDTVAAPVPPPPAPHPKAKFEVVPGAERDLLSVFAGNIESIDATERDVETSDVIARLVGAKRLERDIESLDKDIEKRKTALKAAQDARAKLDAPAEGSAASPPPAEAKVKAAEAAVTKAYAALEEKQNERASKEENLEKLYVRAPFEGHLVVLAKPKQKVEENTVIAKITPKAAPTALFKLEKNMTLERGLAVPVKVGEKLYTCEVADSNADGTRVWCRTDNEGLAPGVEGTLMFEQ